MLAPTSPPLPRPRLRPDIGAVDIVIGHVDGTAPGFAALHKAHAGAMTPCQMRDNGELRYVLRSIAAHAPWVRRVHLAVMDDGHVPAWIDRSRVNVVHHREFMPPQLLPTFHWQAISAHLYAIEDLAERFVIMPDDAFLGRTTGIADFFDGSTPRTDVYDSPIVNLVRYVARDAGAYTAYCLATRAALNDVLKPRGIGFFARTFGHYLYPHGAMPTTRTLWRSMFKAVGEHPAVRATLERRNRADRDDPTKFVLPGLMFCGWVEHMHRRRSLLAMLARCCTGALARLWSRLSGRGAMLYATYSLRNDPKATRRHMQRLVRECPVRFCINDEAYDCINDSSGHWHAGWRVNPASTQAMLDALQQLYPTPCAFERTPRAIALR